MRACIYIILCFVAFQILLLDVDSAGAESGSDHLKIGFIAPLTGSAQAFGQASRNGFELARQEFGSSDRFKVFYQDDEFLPAKTVTAFNYLVEREKVDLIVAIGSTPCRAIAPLAQKKAVPFIAWASDEEVGKNRSFVIRSYPSGFAEGRRVAEEALQRGYQHIAVFTMSSDYAQSWNSGVVATLPQEKVLMVEEMSPQTEDFKPLLLKARQKGVSEFLVCLAPGKSASFAKQTRQLGYTTPMGGCDYFHDKDEIKASNGALLGSWFVTLLVKKDFREKYRKAFANDSVLSGAAVHYDLAKILHQIQIRDQALNISEQLLSVGFQDGVAGPFQIIEKDNDRFFDYALTIKEIGPDDSL